MTAHAPDTTTLLTFAPTHPAFAGHFPGRPVVPGVLLLAAAIEAVEAAAGRRVARITAAKFLQPAGPDQSLTLSFRGIPGERVHFDISSGEQKIASGSLILSQEDEQ